MIETSHSDTRYSPTRLRGVTRSVARVVQVGAMHPLEIYKIPKAKHADQQAKKKKISGKVRHPRVASVKPPSL